MHQHWRKETDTVESPVARGFTGPTALFELFGERPGRVIELGSDRTFIGRDCGSSTGSSVQVPHASVSRQHAIVIRGRDGLSVRDLGSTNGTFVNGHRVETHNLCHGDRVKFGRTLFKVLVDPDLSGVIEVERRRLARVDPLTQLLNRATLFEELRYRLQSGRASVLVGTVNDYERLAARFSGVATDHLLSGLAQVLKKRVPEEQELGRIGQATFAVLLPETAEDEARRQATALARHVAATSFTLDGNAIPLTLSFGVALGRLGQTPEDLLATAVETLPRQLVAVG